MDEKSHEKLYKEGKIENIKLKQVNNIQSAIMQEQNATMQELRATMQELRATMQELRATMQEQNATMQKMKEITNETVEEQRREESEGQRGEESEESQERVDVELDLSPSDDEKTGKEKDPHNTGGRRTGSYGRYDRKDSSSPTMSAKPELICRKLSDKRHWSIILSIPQECNVVKVQHNDTSLSNDNSEYNLSSFTGKLIIEYADKPIEDISLLDHAPMIFKMRNNWEGDGRKMRFITKGYFIVFAPSKWTRKGSVGVAPESCADVRYTAHYFFNKHDGDDDDEKDKNDFEGYSIPRSQAEFTLEGKQISDDPDAGALFIEHVPTLNPTNNIAWARVGEEAENGWLGTNFRPNINSLEDMLDDRQGRFFIRVYNDDVELVDSGEFRYCAGLREILVGGRPYQPCVPLAPSSDGHSPITLKFVGTHKTTIRPKLKKDNSCVIVGPDNLVKVEPHPIHNEMVWSLESCGSTEVVIKLPHIWWKMTNPDGDTNSWCDKVISMSRDEFKKSASSEVVINVRVPSFIDKVYAKFGKNQDRSYSVKPKDNHYQATIPFDEFVDYQEIYEMTSDDVTLRIHCNDVQADLICVVSKPRRTESAVPSKHAEHTNPTQDRNREIPQACVKGQTGRMRRGKGFSHGELEHVGFTSSKPPPGIKIDGRRGTVYDSNVDELRQYIKS